MKIVFQIMGGLILWGSQLGATDGTPTESKNQVIVIQDPKGRGPQFRRERNEYVESGSDAIQGSPEESIKAAYRTWETACKEWKNEMIRLNGKSLIQASCGAPKRSSENLQSQKFYTYESQARFKVRVGGK